MCLIIFTDKTTLLFDCNVTADNEEYILKYLNDNIPLRWDCEKKADKQWIDIFVNSHRDNDHYRGLSKINDTYPIKNIWDSGQCGAATDSSDYQYYMRLRRSIRDKYGENAVIVPSPSREALLSIDGAEVFCLNSSLDFNKDETRYMTFDRYNKLVENKALREGRPQHTNSMVLSVRYKDRSLLLTGDSDYLAWRDKIMPNFKNSNLLKSNILVASHHGSRSFFTDSETNDTIDPDNNPESTYIDHIYKIEPSVTIISCDSYDVAHHPNKEALEIYEGATANKQVYTTHIIWNVAGILGGSGEWTVAPARMSPSSSINKNIVISCKCNNNDHEYEGKPGDVFPIGSTLNFHIQSKHGILEPYSDVDVTWEVSNGGIEEHNENQDIYYKSKDEETGKYFFKRKVAYRGKHLLRCRIRNRKKKITATNIFVVNGE